MRVLILENYLGKTYHELFGSDFGQGIAERFKSVQLTDEGQEYEDVIDLPTGRKWFLSSFTKVVDANGAIAGIQVISKDITERKRTMEALKAERDMAQRYLDVAGVMLLVLDAEARVVLVNKRGCEILGYEEAEIIGRN